jgi:hypothetical protein
MVAGSRIARLPFRYERNVQTFTLTRKSYKKCQRTISKVAEVGVEPTIELTYVMSVVSVPRLVPANSKIIRMIIIVFNVHPKTLTPLIFASKEYSQT